MVRSTLPGPLRQPVFALLGQVYPKLDWAPRPLRAKSTLQALARDSVEGYFHSVSILDDRLRRQLYRSEEHTSELQSLMRISYAVFCLKKKKDKNIHNTT